MSANLRLFLVVSGGWGVEHSVVRARDEAHAKELAMHASDSEVTELSTEGEAAVLWTYDFSPDSPRDRY